jgi:DNA-binding NarL/FixJ family response regulator
MKKPRVLLADDHKIVLEGVRSVVEPECEVVGMVEDGRSLVAEATRLRPDLVVADVAMPMLNGIEAAQQIRKIDKNIRIVFLTMHADASYAASAFEAGASGFVLKHCASAELLTAIRETLQGRTYVTPRIAENLIGSFQHDLQNGKKGAVVLSPRQREVLQLLAEGKSAKEVASILDISARTVEFHKYRMMEQLNIKAGAELVRYAIKTGLTSLWVLPS